jgi:catechol 2,3-dioxygenase-like lactoylglutathione lyase family enzyme
MDNPGKLWVGSVVIETRPAMFHRLVEFWCQALYYRPREPLDDWALLHDPHQSGPNIAIQQAKEEDEVPVAAGRFHLDLYSNDPECEVDRLVGLGASIVEPAQEGRDFVTLSDPDGNLFDVIDTRGYSPGGYRFGQRGP